MNDDERKFAETVSSLRKVLIEQRKSFEEKLNEKSAFLHGALITLSSLCVGATLTVLRFLPTLPDLKFTEFLLAALPLSGLSSICVLLAYRSLILSHVREIKKIDTDLNFLKDNRRDPEALDVHFDKDFHRETSVERSFSDLGLFLFISAIACLTIFGMANTGHKPPLKERISEDITEADENQLSIPVAENEITEVDLRPNPVLPSKSAQKVPSEISVNKPE